MKIQIANKSNATQCVAKTDDYDDDNNHSHFISLDFDAFRLSIEHHFYIWCINIGRGSIFSDTIESISILLKLTYLFPYLFNTLRLANTLSKQNEIAASDSLLFRFFISFFLRRVSTKSLFNKFDEPIFFFSSSSPDKSITTDKLGRKKSLFYSSSVYYSNTFQAFRIHISCEHIKSINKSLSIKVQWNL